MRCVAKSNQPCHVAHRYRRLLDQQLCCHAQAACEQILVEAHLAELRIDACELTR